jgi:hypothetical protein
MPCSEFKMALSWFAVAGWGAAGVVALELAKHIAQSRKRFGPEKVKVRPVNPGPADAS